MTKPSDFDEISNQLWDAELKELQDLWATYNYLYVEDPERAEKLRKPRWGGLFWDLAQGWMVSGIILSVSRLTDPPKMGKHWTLTLSALLDDPRLPGQLVQAGMRVEEHSESGQEDSQAPKQGRCS